MKIFVKDSLNNKDYEVEVDEDTSVDVLKLKLSSKYELNYNLLVLSFQNTELKNSNTKMKDLNIVDGSVFNIVNQKPSKF
jgi:hypothetical protein